MKYRISEDVLSQMIFYNVLQSLRKHCVPEEYLDECLVDLSTFDDKDYTLKSGSGEHFVQGALICTKNHIEDHDPPIIVMLRSTNTIQIAFPKLIPDVIMLIRITNDAVLVDSSGQDPLPDEMIKRVTYFGNVISNCLLDILPPGSDIYFKEDFHKRLMNIMEKFKDFIASMPDDDDDTEDDEDGLEETQES